MELKAIDHAAHSSLKSLRRIQLRVTAGFESDEQSFVNSLNFGAGSGSSLPRLRSDGGVTNKFIQADGNGLAQIH